MERNGNPRQEQCEIRQTVATVALLRNGGVRSSPRHAQHGSAKATLPSSFSAAPAPAQTQKDAWPFCVHLIWDLVDLLMWAFWTTHFGQCLDAQDCVSCLV